MTQLLYALVKHDVKGLPVADTLLRVPIGGARPGQVHCRIRVQQRRQRVEAALRELVQQKQQLLVALVEGCSDAYRQMKSMKST